MATAGLGLPFAPPTRPVQAERVRDMIVQDDRQQAAHFRDGHRDQAALSPLLASVWATARVTSRKA
jgi:hypothetical protein